MTLNDSSAGGIAGEIIMGLFDSLFGRKKDYAPISADVLKALIASHQEDMAAARSMSPEDQMTLGVGIWIAMNCIREEFGDPQGNALVDASKRLMRLAHKMKPTHAIESYGVVAVAQLLMVMFAKDAGAIHAMSGDLKKIQDAVPLWARDAGSRFGP